jgi:hypothetical protein
VSLCIDKDGYETRDAVIRMILSRIREASSLTWYKCGFCGKYHITKQRPKKPGRIQ